MRKICIIFLLSIIITITAVGFSPTGRQKTSKDFCDSYLRIHIRADSNADEAQSVKYAVRDEVVAYLTPIVASCTTKAEAVEKIGARLTGLESVAKDVLLEKGFSYGATASIEQETFPTRVYEDYTLPAGEYTALILRLGKGEGDNWWCVVYPPLCFAAPTGQNVVYKSKIAEIIRAWRVNGE